MHGKLLARLLAAATLTGCAASIPWARPSKPAELGQRACLRSAGPDGVCLVPDTGSLPRCEISAAHREDNAKGAWGHWYGRWQEDREETERARRQAPDACCWACTEAHAIPGGRPIVVDRVLRVASAVPRAWDDA